MCIMSLVLQISRLLYVFVHIACCILHIAFSKQTKISGERTKRMVISRITYHKKKRTPSLKVTVKNQLVKIYSSGVYVTRVCGSETWSLGVGEKRG